MKIEKLLGEQKNKLLFELIKQKWIVQMSQKQANGWQLMKAQVLGGSPNQKIQISEPNVTYGHSRVLSGQISANFRVRNRRLVFQSYHNEGSLSWPEQLIQTNRRLFYRERPPKSVIVRFWKASSGERKIIYGELQNLSGSGMGVTARAANYEGLYVCSIDLEGSLSPLIFEAIVRSTEIQDQRSHIGFHFVGIDLDPVKHLNRLGRVLGRWRSRRRGGNAPTSSGFTNQSQSFEVSPPQNVSRSLEALRSAT